MKNEKWKMKFISSGIVTSVKILGISLGIYRVQAWKRSPIFQVLIVFHCRYPELYRMNKIEFIVLKKL